jgi:pimeloyl-ACP methyl ester carboxylesterase
MIRLTVPPPHSTFDAVMDDGAVIALRRHGNLSGPRIILSHGNGLAINGYFPYWGLFLADFEVVVFDFRNCGENPVQDGAHGYDRFLADFDTIYDAIDTEFGKKTQIGAFHSMSSRANLKYALDGNRRLDGLVVFDPPMVPPKGHPLHDRMDGEERVLCRWAGTRPDGFDDPAEQAALFRKSRMLSNWADGAYDLMARSILRRDAATGKWMLVCSGAREAEIYRQNAELNIWPHATEFPMPVLVVASDPDSKIPSAPGYACRALRDECGWAYECVPGTGHFLQIQEPAICAGITRRFAAEIDLISE